MAAARVDLEYELTLSPLEASVVAAVLRRAYIEVDEAAYVAADVAPFADTFNDALGAVYQALFDVGVTEPHESLLYTIDEQA